MSKWSEIIEFNDQYFPNWRKTHPVFYSNALAGETGEVCNLTKKLAGGGTKKNKVNPSDVSEECVDVYIYLVLLLESSGFSKEQFEQAFKAKMEINKARMQKANESSQDWDKDDYPAPKKLSLNESQKSTPEAKV